MDFHHLVQELWAIEFRGLIHVRLWDFLLKVETNKNEP